MFAPVQTADEAIIADSAEQAWQQVTSTVPAWWPAALSKTAFHAALRDKGWTLSDMAFAFGVSIATASRLAADPERDAHWVLALQALPRLTRREQQQLRAARARLWPRARVGLPEGEMAAAAGQGGFRYVGVIEQYESVACHRSGDLAEEGDERGCILALQDTANGQQYLVAFPAGRAWFGADAFDQYFYTTGRLLSAAERVALGVTDD